MRSWKNSHPDPEDLIRFCDGELSSRAAARIARHIESCWECRTEVEDNTGVIGQYVHYRRSMLPERIPPPPSGWKDLKQDFARIRSEREQAGERQRLESWLPFFRTRATVLAATFTILLFCGMAFMYLVQAPAARAAELIEKAVTEERRTSNSIGAVVRVQTRMGTFARPAKLDVPGTESYLAHGDVALSGQVELWFRSARYNWLRPLSAGTFAAWRNQLSEKRDAVVTRGAEDSEGLYEVQTSTNAGALGEVTLFLRRSDLHAVRCEFQFRNGERIDIYETPTDRTLPGPATPPSAAPSAQAQAGRSGQETPPIRVGPQEELRVLAALHRIGADLGDPLNLERQKSRIVVSGVGVNEQRQREIKDALRPLPAVVTQFSQVQRTSVSPQLDEAAVEKPAAPSNLARRIEQQVGGVAMEKLSDSLLKLTETLLVRVHALRLLGDRFPPEVESGFDATDRASLDNMRLEHEESIIERFDQIDAALSPVLVQLGLAVPVPRSVAGAEPWQVTARSCLVAAQRFDRVLASTLAPTSGTIDDSEELGGAFSALRVTVAAFRNDFRQR